MKDQSVSRFWEKYIEKTKDLGVKPGALRWYVRDAELYIKAHSNTKLINHEPHFVERYLERKGRNTRLEEWQFIQLITAIKILFTKMVHVSWAEQFPWDDWIEQAEQLPKAKQKPANRAEIVRSCRCVYHDDLYVCVKQTGCDGDESF